MAIEIEHKFLLLNDNWRKLVTKSTKYKQGYLASEKNTSIRVRISDNEAWLNIKSATIGNFRHEYEYEIPYQDAEEIINNLCRKPLIEKTRHLIPISPHIWEIDEFEGENQGLIVAEIELQNIDQSFNKPEWIGQEVTHDLRYYNNNLSLNPFSKWT
jgi:adenylate cyclase